MKTKLSYLIMVMALAATSATMVTTTGCRSTDTRRTTGEYIDDKTVVTRVKSALFADPNVSGFQVKVDSFEGVVQLNGFVDTAAQKARAEEIARGVEGVRQVKNYLMIRESIPPRASGT